jgi:hypothetical protein
VNGLSPTIACIQKFAYPLSSKLYLDTMLGFSAVTGQELALSRCLADLAITNTGLTQYGFIPPPSGVFCEDFNEKALCGASSNINACTNNAAVGLPTTSTTCGNGVLEQLEECDNGASNGIGASCSLTCRKGI